MVEDGGPPAAALAATIQGYAGRAHVIGLTGPPGVGKSTTTNALIGMLRRGGRRVAVLAVDPSSPFSGGALLGDRIRMSEHSTDPGVFIRSSAARGRLGGLAWSTPQAIRLLDAVGFDSILVETVGVGQSEVDIARLADTTVVLLAPGMGDGVQAAKAGVLETGDVFAVNKSDRPGAEATERDLRAMLARGIDRRWVPPVIATVAASGEGIAALADAIDDHRRWLDTTGRRRERQVRRAADEIEALALAAWRARIEQGQGLARLAEAVVDGAVDPYAAADQLGRG